MIRHFWLGIAVAATLAVSHAVPARAIGGPMTFCNRTANEMGVAVAYHTPGVNDSADHAVLTGPFVSQGYVHLQPGSCRTFDNPSSARYMFWFAYSSALNTSPGLIGMMSSTGVVHPQYSFCVRRFFVSNAQELVPAFTYEDENVSSAACYQAGGRTDGPPASDGDTLWVTGNKVDLLVNPNVDFTGCKTSQCAEFWNDKQ